MKRIIITLLLIIIIFISIITIFMMHLGTSEPKLDISIQEQKILIVGHKRKPKKENY